MNARQGTVLRLLLPVRFFLNRDADPDGVAYWQAKLEGEEAVTRLELMKDFTNSREYKDYQDTLKK